MARAVPTDGGDARRGSRHSPTPPLQMPALAPLPTAAERAAEVIRDNIFEGRFQPGTALPENTLAQALRVSRNTVREALRTLVNERLLAYEAHKGVTVRRLAADDVRDIYRLRRMLELGAVDTLAAGAGRLDGAALRDSLAAGDQAAAAGDWVAAGTASLRFHALLVSVHGSRRIDEIFRSLITELRLGFLALADPHEFHEPYLRRNHEVGRRLEAGDWAAAHAELARYLDDALRQVLAAVDGAT
ncbi:GntR family transcriptional regulator [Plantactinospora sp. GCM10030261]|uniref:GntR family transcriptional regulator n=1 Tax=Plantactinospora sp. GCM10030261 TaxID=3273420 RepID=UPI00361001F9